MQHLVEMEVLQKQEVVEMGDQTELELLFLLDYHGLIVEVALYLEVLPQILFFNPLNIKKHYAL
jgi:hypothetical protein